MNALLIVLHGSRLAEGNRDVLALAARIAAEREGRWDTVSLGFLQFGAPPLAEALEQLASDGAKRITAVPLFLGAGRHVAEDVPRVVSAFSNAHPEVQVLVTPHLGAWKGLAAAVAALARQSEDAPCAEEERQPTRSNAS